MTDPALQQKYADAAASYAKAIESGSERRRSPTREALAVYYQNQGKALGRQGKLKESAAAYDASAKAFPAGAGSAYYNESAELFNQGKSRRRLARRRPRPLRPTPSGRTPTTSERSRWSARRRWTRRRTSSCCLRAAWRTTRCTWSWLPDGKFAAEVQDLLKNLGQPVKNSFKAGKKG